MRIQPALPRMIEERLLKANGMAGTVVDEICRKSYLRKEDRLARQIHVRLVHEILNMIVHLGGKP